MNNESNYSDGSDAQAHFQLSPETTVLIVDDEPINVILIEDILRESYRTLSASNGVEAIELCNSEHVDLILLDIMMPEIDGYGACKFLKNSEKTKKNISR